MTAPNNRSVFYVGAQAEAGTAIALGSCSPVRVVSSSITKNQTMIERGDHDQANDGGLAPLPGPVDCAVEVVVELKTPATAGTASTWQQRLLWQAAPLAVTEAVSPARLLIAPRSGRLAYTHYTPVTVYKVEHLGRILCAKDVVFAPPKLQADAGGIIRATFSGRGRYVEDAAWDSEDTQGLYTYTVTTGAVGTWTVRIVDDLGNLYTASAATTDTIAADVAADLRSGFTSSIAPAGITVAGSGADVTFASPAGRSLTITVTPPGGGAGTLATTTAPLAFAERPTYASDTGTVCKYVATTVTDSRGTLSTVGAWNLDVGAEVVARQGADGEHGYVPPMPGPSMYAKFRFVHDVQNPGDLDLGTSFVEGTEISLSIGSSSSKWLLSMAQAKVTSQQDTDNGSARGYDETITGYSSGSSTNHWQLTLY